MHESEHRLNALAYALGWLTLIGFAWVTVAWLSYLARLAGHLSFLPEHWLPTPEVHLIFIGLAKLMIIAVAMAWLGVVLYRRRLRRTWGRALPSLPQQSAHA